MEKEWFSIIDTAVKIGLGALLTGIFSYLGVKSSKGLEKVKFLLEHKIKMLEKASEEIEKYLYSWQLFTGAASGVALRRKNRNAESEPLAAKSKEFLKKHSNILEENWQYREFAIAKLRLLGADAVAEALIECRDLEKELRNPITFDGRLLSHEEIELYKARMREQYAKIHSALAGFYKSLH